MVLSALGAAAAAVCRRAVFIVTRFSPAHSLTAAPLLSSPPRPPHQKSINTNEKAPKENNAAKWCAHQEMGPFYWCSSSLCVTKWKNSRLSQVARMHNRSTYQQG